MVKSEHGNIDKSMEFVNSEKQDNSVFADVPDEVVIREMPAKILSTIRRLGGTATASDVLALAPTDTEMDGFEIVLGALVDLRQGKRVVRTTVESDTAAEGFEFRYELSDAS